MDTQNTIDTDNQRSIYYWNKYQIGPKICQYLGCQQVIFNVAQDNFSKYLDRKCGIDGHIIFDGYLQNCAIRGTAAWNPLDLHLTFRLKKNSVGLETEIAKAHYNIANNKPIPDYFIQFNHFEGNLIGIVIVNYQLLMNWVWIMKDNPKYLRENKNDKTQYLKILVKDLPFGPGQLVILQ